MCNSVNLEQIKLLSLKNVSICELMSRSLNLHMWRHFSIPQVYKLWR